MDSILSIQNLVKKYGNMTAVDGISLEIPRGSFFGFLGPNGAGKSTTINCIIGVGRITSGSIVVNGHDVVKDYREARRQIGISPQEFNTDFFGKPEDIIDAMAGYHGIPKNIRKERTEELLEKFDLLPHRAKKFNELSGGLKRRVILARALVSNPDLLILDEPTAGVDVEQRHDLWRYFKELNDAGKTIILTSHYLEEVELLCKEIAIINKGKIVAQGSKESFIKNGQTLEQRYLAITKGETY
ncbi:ABC transporter ATP-binding protein [Patescibacteria group bacterium]|jgi:ABC-2 type transport system ATP-binding protein|nr:ABC transporter ATP-binding protein [Patescibacteria group bacterium]